MKKNLFTTLCAIGTLGLCSCSAHVDNQPISQLDLNRYLGKWYEIARYDHRFERGMSNTTALYSLQEDGKVRVENSGWKEGKQKTSIGKAKTTDHPALLRVSFFGPFYSDYRVLMLTEDYSVAVVGSKSADYLWILSREPLLDIPTILAVKAEIIRRGYDYDKLIWVDQTANMEKKMN